MLIRACRGPDRGTLDVRLETGHEILQTRSIRLKWNNIEIDEMIERE